MIHKPSILIVDDEKTAADTIRQFLTDEDFTAFAVYAATDALDLMSSESINVAIVDLRMPQMDGMALLQRIKERFPEVFVIMITAYATIGTAVDAMKRGAYDYITKPFKIDELLLVIRRALDQQRLEEENHSLRQQLEERYGLENIIGVSPKMLRVFQTVHKLAPTEATVMVRGESGTGKELVARAIHHNSPRHASRFLAIDCGALPRDLLESELFGHVRGSFTGAIATKYGLFEAASTGTVFLDEIGNAPVDIQIKLLRVLQDHEIRRVGDTQPIKVDVRIVAATNQPLEDLIKAGTFREELYYRLNVVTLELPPLRQRMEDIPLLAYHFLQRYAEANSCSVKHISEEALQLLRAYGWPGNVRELEHVIERAVILCETNTITPEDLPQAQRDVDLTNRPDDTLPAMVQRYERGLIEEALQRNQGNQYRAAKELNISRQSLQYKLRKYGLLDPSRSSSAH